MLTLGQIPLTSGTPQTIRIPPLTKGISIVNESPFQLLVMVPGMGFWYVAAWRRQSFTIPNMVTGLQLTPTNYLAQIGAVATQVTINGYDKGEALPPDSDLPRQMSAAGAVVGSAQVTVGEAGGSTTLTFTATIFSDGVRLLYLRQIIYTIGKFGTGPVDVHMQVTGLAAPNLDFYTTETVNGTTPIRESFDPPLPAQAIGTNIQLTSFSVGASGAGSSSLIGIGLLQ